MSLNKIWKDYNLSVVLAILFLTSWIVQTFTGWYEFRGEQQAHQEAAQFLGDSGYIWVWLRATFENWQSEFLQLFTFVALTGFLIHKGSPESKDGDEEVKATLARIEHKVQQLERSQHSKNYKHA